MNAIVSYLRRAHVHVKQAIKLFSGPSKPDIYSDLCYAVNNIAPTSVKASKLSILETIIDNGFLWAVPKHKRSLERRMTRRMGYGKLLLPKRNIVVCDACGHFHPVHTVCGNCYEKVKEETTIMQEAVLKELKLDPIEKEVVVLYEDELKDRKMFQGKHIVELPKESRPWFSKNLLAKDSETKREKTKSIGPTEILPKLEETPK